MHNIRFGYFRSALGVGALWGLLGVGGCGGQNASTTTASSGGASTGTKTASTSNMASGEGASGATETPGTIRVGYWPVASALPFFVAMDKGYFKKAGLTVEGQKFSSPQQVSQELIAGRLQFAANGTATGALALAEIAQPGLLKVVATNVSDSKNVLDEVIVSTKSSAKSMADFKGKTFVFACGPGPQNVATAQAILNGNGITTARIQQVDIKQHVAAVASGQADAAYTLEPTGTIGAGKNLTRVLETGVVAKYIVGGPGAQSHGGAAALTTKFIKDYPETSKKFLSAYREAIEDIRKNPDAARQYLKGYTPLTTDIAGKLPLIPYKMYDEMQPRDVQNLQKFFDYMTTNKVFKQKVDAKTLIYQPV